MVLIPSDIAAKLGRYLSSPGQIRRFFAALRDRRTILRSAFFDHGWYLRQNPEVATTRADPALHYLLAGHPARRNPGPDFIGDEYLFLHPEARASGLNPLVHYERFGKKRGLAISLLDSPPPAPPRPRFSPDAHQAAFPAKIERLRRKASDGVPLRAVFLVASPSMFPARPLLDAMRRDPAFDPRIAVVPDLRWASPAEAAPAAKACRAELARAYPDSLFLPVSPAPDGAFPDILSDADLVCYPSPYDISDFHYNPPFAIGRPFLPIHVNYGFYRSLYDRHVMAQHNYALFWKVFFESPETLAEYQAVSPIHGANAALVGYVKMDPLADCPPLPSPHRPRVLLCPHHSIEGGLNTELALSNFLRFSDFFLSLPDRFPAIDFVLRPHPFLFPALAKSPAWGPARADDWKRRWLSRPNASWSASGDVFPLFAQSDACIQDCGSFLPEWFYTGKPQCYLLKSPGDIPAKFSPLGQECLRRCYLAYDAAAILDFLQTVVLGGNDPLAPERRAFASRLMLNYPHAAQAALDAIRADLDL